MSITLGHSGRRTALAVAFGAAVLLQLPIAGTATAATTKTTGGLTCTIVGTSGDDVLVGTSGRDVICGLGGNDKIKGNGGDDVVDGGSGNDTIYGGPGIDYLFGGAGTDKLYGDTGGAYCDTTSGETSKSCTTDTTKPVAASWRIDKSEVSTASGPQTVTVTARVTDNFAGVPAVNLRLVGANATYGGVAKRTSGTEYDGNYSLAIVVPANAAAGNYVLHIEAVDRAGNARTPATSSAVKVIGDTTAPYVSTVQFEYTTYTLKPTKVVATATVEDPAGVSVVKIRIVKGDPANGGVEAGGTATKNAQGKWVAEFPLAKKDTKGSYDVYAYAEDAKGNKKDTKMNGTLNFGN